MRILVVLVLVIVLVKTYAKNVLITGGAGFIGFHTAVKLTEDSDSKVVVLDIFDDSYSVDLKKARAGVLKDKGVVVQSGDVCNQQMLDHLFDHHKFQYVIHMAGKDDSTSSMKEPDSFIQANTECLLTLLRVLSSHKTTQLVYASSYNVLDENYKGLTPAISLLSALKTGVEKFVTAYCEEFDISAVGIRPFSVYGPWGRPDGDIYRMALDIDSGDPVEIYADKNSIIASRDYTYIDDVVNGIVAAMDYKPEKCGEIFNIASGMKPVAMDTVFTLLKDKMHKEAEQKTTPLPLYEPLQVLGDISTARTVLGYNPVTSIEEGITKFVEWFDAFHHKKKWKQYDPDNSLSRELEKAKVMYVNKKYKERLVSIRQEYEKKAIANGLPVTKYYHKTFKKFKGVDPGSHPRGSFKTTSISLLTDWCRIIDECVAFNSKGHLFSYIAHQDQWKPSQTDLYVADIDVCEAGLTTCYGNCTCKYKGPGQAENGCPKGYGILHKNEQQDFCYELYAKGKTTNKEKEFMILDKVEDRDWDEFIKGKSYEKFANKYFDYGVIAYYPEAKGNIDKLKGACDDTYHCIGFTDTGELKGIIDHVHKWKKSDHTNLYIRDVNYCKLHEEKCDCKRTKPGEYSCTGKKKP